MIDLNKMRFKHLAKAMMILKEAFNNHIDQNIKISGSLLQVVFSKSFFQSEFYLVFPYLFKKVFNEGNERFSRQLCISGFLYFKYLLSLDDLIDDDAGKTEGKEDNSIQLLRSHIYHQESLKILATHFGKNKTFWALWNQRNNEFLKSVLLDKEYNLTMPFETYKLLCICKCSFSKVAADSLYSRHPGDSVTYADLIQSIDLFSIARCIQDDVEDFTKDLQFKKNNLGHVLLAEWLKKKGKKFEDHSPELLGKYFFTAEIAETMLSMSKEYYQKAIDMVNPYKEKLLEYIQTLELLRNNVNYYKVNIQAYRLDTYFKNINSKTILAPSNLGSAITLSRQYIANMQHTDGSWYEISNKQGLSNVWATGFISSFLTAQDECLSRAGEFLLKHKQGSLWGYNTDWVFDYDSTTSVLLSLNKIKQSVEPFMHEWFKGQRDTGGFSTYPAEENGIFSSLGLKKKDVKGWVGSHTCVSALAYYFIHTLPADDRYHQEKEMLKNYLLSQQNKNGVWNPYWWTSFIYPTCFIVQGMLMEGDNNEKSIQRAMDHILRQQNSNGSFSCDVLKKESPFYSALVLDTLCASDKLFQERKKEAAAIQQWLLSRQYSNGRFESTDFLVIPNPDVTTWKPSRQTFQQKKNGGSNSITGEVASLFSTAVSLRALERFRNLN